MADQNIKSTDIDLSGVDKNIIEKFQKNTKNLVFKTSDNEDTILTILRNLYLSLTVNLGKDWHPYINGRYMIFMVHGPWVNHIATLKNNYNISPATIDFFTNLVNKKDFNYLFPKIATDIDLPQLNNEYISVSTRNQSITYFLRQSLLPDFSISYIEDQQKLSIIQYHDAWFKSIELYRRGLISSTADTIENQNIRPSPYFYSVPYLNGIWVLIFDISLKIRGLIYLIGVKPVNHPLKEFLGNRSNSKMTVYNIQYKTTNMYYEFFNDTEDFITKLKSNKGILINKFKTTILTNFINANKLTDNNLNTKFTNVNII